MKKNTRISLGLILLLSLFVLYLRIHMLFLPVINQIAQDQVYNEHFTKIRDKLEKDYAGLPSVNKAKLINQAYKTYLNQNKYFLQEEVKAKAREKKAFYQNDNSYTYMMGIDSYYWLRLIDNLIHKGHIGEAIVNGQDYDELVNAPIEKSLSRSSHLFLGKFLYKIFDYLKLNIDYAIGLYLIPLLFSVLMVIFTFFITQLLGRSNIAAFFAAIAVNFCPLLLQRSMGEWLDTDIYNVFFPLVIFGAFLFVFKSSTNNKKVLGLLAFALSCAIYASIWQGWWYIFDLLILCGLVFIINEYTSEDKDKILLKKNIFWLSSLFLLGILFTGLLNGKDSLLSFIVEPSKLIFALKDVPKDNWPNVFLTVAELKRVAPYRIALELGGMFIFFVTIIGSVYLVLVKKVIRDKELGIGFFCLFIWLGALYYTSLNAMRFALLLVVPLGIMFGIVLDWVIKSIFNFALKYPKKIRFSILGVLTLGVYFLISFYFNNCIAIAATKIPMMNDAWHKSLMLIKESSSGDAAINSWWDFGHWFTAVSKRRVLFDGKTQNSPIAYWMAKVLVTDDEKEAVGILRMLNISNNKAFELLDSYGFTHSKIVSMLLDVLKLSSDQAREHLKDKLDQEKIEKLMPLIFSSKTPEAYFIASYDMVSKMRSISHIGNWDFKKGDIWINASRKRPEELMGYLKSEYGYSNEEAISLWRESKLLSDREAPFWISKVNVIDVESLSTKFKKEDNLLMLDDGLAIDLTKHKAFVFRGPGVDIGVPYSLVYIEDGILKENILEDSNLDYSVLLYRKDEDSYNSIFLDKNLAKSMFVRMYFLAGEGLSFFEKLKEEKTPDGNSIFVFKIKWPE